MFELFNWFGSILGYLLWFLYSIVRNYGVSILLFTIIMKLLMFPFSIKQQRSMASQAKLQKTVKELQAIYGNDKMKLSEETQKLYAKEGASPTGGCLPMLIPFPILFGIYYSVLYPLQNAVHCSAEHVKQAISLLSQIPGLNISASNQYAEMDIIKHFESLKPYLTNIFTPDEMNNIEFFSHGFNFLGLNLLATPSSGGFASMLWLIPVLCLVSSLVTQFVTMKLQPGMQQQAGCMKVVMYVMPLFTAYLAFIMPAAVGFYWTAQTLISFIQTLALQRFYSPADLNARAEAARIALRDQEEAKMKPLPLETQALVRTKLEAKNLGSQPQKKKNTQEKKQSAAKNKGTKNANDYRGEKK